MKLLHAALVALCVLLVPIVDCQFRSMAGGRRTASSNQFVQSRFGDPTATTVQQKSSPSTKSPTGLAVPPENDPEIAQMMSDFMIRISRTLAQQQSKTELFSPVSIASVTNLLFLGSNGVTHAEFGRVLAVKNMTWMHYHRRYSGVLANLLSKSPVDNKNEQWRRQQCPADDYDDDSSNQPEGTNAPVIRLANGIFHQKSLKMREGYKRIARDLYGAQVRSFDERNTDRAAMMINLWVKDVTAGKIPNMLDGPLSPSSSVVIVNALYFKGKWKTQFEPLVTRPAPFFPDGYDGPSFTVSLMSLSGCLPFFKTRDAMKVSIVGLPYQDETSTMYLIQPENSSRTAIRRLQATLTGKKLETWIGQMKRQSTSVRLPKMHLKSSVDLLQSFNGLGVRTIFSAAKSNLTNMIEPKQQVRPFVNQIMHKVDLAIDEEGTEGAAATSALIDRIGSQNNFNGNTPFLIYLRHDPTGMPLFYGAVFDPR